MRRHPDSGHTGRVLEILVVPVCFLVAGVVGYRLGTPPRVAGGLVAVATFHLLAFLGSSQALATEGVGAAWVHLASQVLFLGGFAAFVWLAAVYPDQRPSTPVVVTAGVLAVVGPLLTALSAASPAVVDGDRELGPVAHLAPAGLAGVAAASLLLLPMMAIGTFTVRYRRAGPRDRTAMRWPLGALALLVAVVVAGSLLDQERQAAATVLFLLAAPVFPLAVAFGPVVRHLDTMTADLAEARRQRTRPAPPEGVLATLSPREAAVLQRMAEGMANPVIARSMHLSLSSVEKHATSVFRKLQIPEGPDVHRRVAAVVAYRDALEGARESPRP